MSNLRGSTSVRVTLVTAHIFITLQAITTPKPGCCGNMGLRTCPSVTDEVEVPWAGAERRGSATDRAAVDSTSVWESPPSESLKLFGLTLVKHSLHPEGLCRWWYPLASGRSVSDLGFTPSILHSHVQRHQAEQPPDTPPPKPPFRPVLCTLGGRKPGQEEMGAMEE